MKYDGINWMGWLVIITIALLFTLSLAGYLLFIIGYVFHGLSRGGLYFSKKVVVIVLVSLISIYAAMNYNQGDNLVNSFILERLEYDEDNGISGNNRVDDDTDSRFMQLVGTDVFWFGYDADTYNQLRSSDAIHGSGYKVYILSRGVLGVLLIFLT